MLYCVLVVCFAIVGVVCELCSCGICVRAVCGVYRCDTISVVMLVGYVITLH